MLHKSGIHNRQQATRNTQLTTALVLFLITVLSRIPFRSQILYHWDSVNFAFAMRKFDVAAEQPQPPGYIVYVWLCRLVDVIFHDPQATMVWISIVSSALAVVALYLLGRAMWGQQVGVIAALLLASSPLFWFYGEIALPHTLDTFLVILSVWLLYEVMRGRNGYLIPAVVVLALAGGVRQQTLVFLLPVILFAVRRVGLRRLFLAGAMGAVLCLGWFIPLVANTGGVRGYLEVMGKFSERFQQSTSVLMGAGWRGVAYNVRKLAIYTAYGWGLAAVPAVLYAGWSLWRRRRPRWERWFFLGLWAGPTLVFYSFVHMGQQGLVFVFLPALLLVSAVGLERLVEAWARRQWWLWVTAAFLVLINVGIFCLVPEYPLGPGTQRLLTRATLVNSDRYYQERFAAIQENFPPEHTVIMAANWHHLEYYLPTYTLLRLDQGPPNRPRSLTPRHWPGRDGKLTISDLGLTPDTRGEMSIVLFDERILNLYPPASSGEAIPLPGGGQLWVLRMSSDDRLHYGADGFGVIGR